MRRVPTLLLSMLHQNSKTMKANSCLASPKQPSTSPPHASVGFIRRVERSRKDSSPRRQSCWWTTALTCWAQIWGNCARDSKSCRSWERIRIRRSFFKPSSIAFLSTVSIPSSFFQFWAGTRPRRTFFPSPLTKLKIPRWRDRSFTSCATCLTSQTTLLSLWTWISR